VSEGAIANSPIETQRSLSNTGRNVVPLFVVFQIPPAAAATKKVLEGLGMPTTLETRPIMLAGPTLRQRKPARSVESRVILLCAVRGEPTTARTASAVHRRRVMTASSRRSWCGETVQLKKYVR